MVAVLVVVTGALVFGSIFFSPGSDRTVEQMIEGRIVKSGGKELAISLEEKGYDWVEEEVAQRA